MKDKKQQNTINEVNLEDEILVVEESRGKRIINAVVNALLVVAIALAAMCTYVSFVSSSGNGVPSLFGIRIFSIQTESMYPTLLPGDLIFDTAVKETEELRNGDIITYWTVINGERVLNTHRIHEIYDGGGYLIFATKGDNNTIADPLTVHESEIVGKYAFRIGGLGKVFDYLQTSTGFLIVIVIPVFLFFLFHLIQFFRVLFAYQNVKNRIKFEQERGATEDLLAEQQKQQADAQALARAKMEEELRERLRAEIMASMQIQKPAESAPAQTTAPAPEPAPAQTVASTPAPEAVLAVETTPEVKVAPAAETAPEVKVASAAETTPEVKETPAVEAPAEKAPAAEEKPAAPVMDEAAIEAIIAKQREAIEAQLREKIRAEMMESMNQPKAEQKTEDTAKA